MDNYNYQQQTNQQNQTPQGRVIYPTQTESEKALASIATLLKEATNTIPVLRREFRGEALYRHDNGSMSYVQITKPVFIVVNPETEEPVMEEVLIKNSEGNLIKKKQFVPNDEAIEEVLSQLKFMGINQITLLTNIDENTIMDDLREFECKLAGLLALKQKVWGIDKELLPMTMAKIKTIVQDARYQACEGSTLKAIQKTVSRVEQVLETTREKKSPYN